MNDPKFFLLGVLCGYLVATVTESFFHNHVQHARRSVRRIWERYPLIGRPFLRAYYSHHTIHHSKTYRRDHITQFRDQGERRRLDEALTDWHGRLIQRERYGLSLADIGILMFILPVLPLLPLIHWVLGGWGLAGALIPISLYPALSKFIHPSLHMSFEQAIQTTTGIRRRLLQTRYIQFIWRHHFLHHRYIRCNYNLLFGGDWLLGCYRRPNGADSLEMSRLGLPLSQRIPPLSLHARNEK